MNERERRLFEKAYKYFEDKKSLESSKKDFDKEAMKYFDNVDFTSIESDESLVNKIKINKSQRKTINFDISKLSKRLPKKMMKQISKTTIEVEDYLGLSNYLRKIGADPKIVKSFLKVSKKVDEKQLEQLFDLGKIKLQDLEGCYSVVLGNPYFIVSVK